jgi:hypothetical protein
MIALIISCGPKQEKIERYMKDGVEVIVNHLEPYRIEGEPNTLHLEEEFTIDTEKDYIAERGLVDIENFDVDSKGNIYCLYNRGGENCIYKFGKDGNFVDAFGRRGRGPGELSYGAGMSINNRDEVIIQNMFQTKLLILNSDGNLINEIPSPSNLPYIKHMENENYFFSKTSRIGPQASQIVWSILSPKFEKIKDIEKQELHGNSRRFSYELHKSYVTEENIYIGKRSQPYEVWVYDPEGNLKRIVKKNYKPIKLSDEYKKKSVNRSEERKKKGRRGPPGKFYLPEYWPAFLELFVGDTGWLFVMTYEKSKNPREFVYDIFNPDGIFIGKMSLNNYGGTHRSLPIKVKNNRLYCLNEKESGYKELVVYKMKWE